MYLGGAWSAALLSLEYTNCLTIGGAQQTPYRYVANAAGGAAAAAPAVPPPPTPEEVAQQAVDNPGKINATATAGVVSVTATAVLTSVTWSMGEPELIPGASGEDDMQRWPSACMVESAPTVTFTCPGPGAGERCCHVETYVRVSQPAGVRRSDRDRLR